MSVLSDLSRLSSAEEFFSYLCVPFDRDVLNVARLHILRRMGQYLRETPAHSTEEEAYEQARGCLLRAYLDFLHSSPIEQRVFKVHRDAGNPPRMPLVQIAKAPDCA
jgi:nitrogenase-stabilizing/protective protein